MIEPDRQADQSDQRLPCDTTGIAQGSKDMQISLPRQRFTELPNSRRKTVNFL